MKSDLKLNFSILEEITEEINIYKSALEDINFAVSNVNTIVEDENSGDTIDSLKEQYKGLSKDIEECYNELDKLSTIFGGYIIDMQSIIRPKNVTQMIRVDRDDIWWNLQSIINACNAVKNIPYTVSYWGQQATFNPTDEVRIREESNYKKIQSIKTSIGSYGNILTSYYEEMNDLFNSKVVPYEEMDDEYGTRAKALKDEFTTFWEGVGDLVTGTFDFVIDVVKGIVGSFTSLVEGLLTLADILTLYTDPLVTAGYIYKKIIGDMPDFLADKIIGNTLLISIHRYKFEE